MFIKDVIIKLLDVFSMILLARVLMSWVTRNPRSHPITRFIYDITEPILKPFRVIIPIGGMGGIDLSVIIVMFGLQFISQMIARF